MATTAQWIEGARPRTLPTAIAPVVVGTAAAAGLGRADLGLATLAMIVALAFQIGVNYANDYSDGVRGTDEERVGPVRLVGQRLAAPGSVKAAAFTFLGIGCLAGLALVALSGVWWLLLIGVAAVLAAWFYTGGSNPYGYRGWGEVFVFVFFGLVATLGTQYTQAHTISWVGLLGAIGGGAWSSAILVTNNLRDIPTDAQTGKMTLAVRLGDAGTRRLYVGLVGTALLCGVAIGVWHPWAFIAALAAIVVRPGVRIVRSGATGRDLIPTIGATSLGQLAWSALLALGIALR